MIGRIVSGIGFGFLINMICNIIIVWAIVSIGASVYKSQRNECNKTYGIERFVSANWLCPVKKNMQEKK